ncbi:hypothetical protein AMV227 [Betaentomopoxvirus amoorei]|uniref:AMV227 n=1 Tax=Amsacta moorei entomopoxvirus TaxID=28321 RepID=Q9EMH9_AMEPV|nr:hypothetical protein AMV227 [Amsacta moorei entomopoxvirus]AAG02933.1 AMV227 [Amsacta moorei entomopoxvirus]
MCVIRVICPNIDIMLLSIINAYFSFIKYILLYIFLSISINLSKKSTLKLIFNIFIISKCNLYILLKFFNIFLFLIFFLYFLYILSK